MTANTAMGPHIKKYQKLQQLLGGEQTKNRRIRKEQQI